MTPNGGTAPWTHQDLCPCVAEWGVGILLRWEFSSCISNWVLNLALESDGETPGSGAKGSQAEVCSVRIWGAGEILSQHILLLTTY